MPTFGLVLTLSDPPAVLAALGADPRARLGPLQGARLPLAWQTDGARDALEPLVHLDGVLAVDIAFADLSDLHGDDHRHER